MKIERVSPLFSSKLISKGCNFMTDVKLKPRHAIMGMMATTVKLTTIRTYYEKNPKRMVVGVVVTIGISLLGSFLGGLIGGVGGGCVKFGLFSLGMASKKESSKDRPRVIDWP